MKPVIVVHGGAGRIFKEREQGSRSGVRKAALRGYGLLKRGGSALDAVEEAVAVMEDDPHFNAGNNTCFQFQESAGATAPFVLRERERENFIVLALLICLVVAAKHAEI